MIVFDSAEAAGAQGKFWEMHDLLFENQDALDDADLLRYAVALKLDAERFERELAAGLYTDRVRRDFRSGALSGRSLGSVDRARDVVRLQRT